MAQKLRVAKNTVQGAVESFQDIQKGIQPPMHLNDRELFYFNQIVTSREAATWSANDKLIACHLAKTYYRLELVDQNLQLNGFVLESNRGTPVQNPACSALNSLMNASQAMNRILGLSASQKGISDAEQKKRNLHEQGMREAIGDTKEEGLI